MGWKLTRAGLRRFGLCIVLAACGGEPEGAVDRAALVMEFAATPSSIRPGQSALLSWSANGIVTAVRITAGECPQREVNGPGFVSFDACEGEAVVASDVPRSGTLRVTPGESTTYWCFPYRARGAAFVFGRTARVEVTP